MELLERLMQAEQLWLNSIRRDVMRVNRCSTTVENETMMETHKKITSTQQLQLNWSLSALISVEVT